MNRNYTNKDNNVDVCFFSGVEVEHTPAHGLQTLFVVGTPESATIDSNILSHEHLFFGANHSFSATSHNDFQKWEQMITRYLKLGYLCSLDIPVYSVSIVINSSLNSYNNFIPQIRVSIPHVQKWNYNTMIKIDDTGFNETNPGVWTHSLHNLKDRDVFTSWDAYKSDTAVINT